MGLGDAPTPVGDTEVNRPIPTSGDDAHNQVANRLTVLERAGNAELVRQIRWLYDFLGQTYPPP